MKKLLIALCVIGLFSACVAPSDSIAWKKSKFHKVEGEKVVYFQYPDSGSIEGNFVRFDNCKVEFGKFGAWNDLLERGGRRVESKKISFEDGGNGVFENWFNDMKIVVLDAGGRDDMDLGFWIYDDGNETKYDCRVALEKLIRSITDTPVYQNDRFGFSVALSPDYKAEEMPSGEGVLMKKFVEGVDWIIGDEEGNKPGYVVEISFFGENNIMNWPDLTALLVEKYDGFDKEFEGNGVYVNEGSGIYSVRHFFMMSSDSVLRGMLKVDSMYYNHHKDEFDALVKGFKAS